MTKHFVGGVAALVALMACVPPPPPAAAPRLMRTTLRPERVVQVSAQELAAADFEITLSDAPGGVLQARRVRKNPGNGDYQICRWPKGSLGDTQTRSTLQVSVSAVASNDSSNVRIGASMSSIVEVLDGKASDSDCVSNGVIEQRLAAALKRAESGR
jgi:hypothetical protein